jgi:type IV pilus assembly protein PilE
VAIEQYFLDNRTYVGMPCPTSTARFAITCANGNPPATTYTITATGSGNVNGFVYTLNEQGARTTTSASWGNSAVCWVIKKGGLCGG